MPFHTPVDLLLCNILDLEGHIVKGPLPSFRSWVVQLCARARARPHETNHVQLRNLGTVYFDVSIQSVAPINQRRASRGYIPYTDISQVLQL